MNMKRVVLAAVILFALSIPTFLFAQLRWVTGYVTDWDSPRMPVADIEWEGLTHIVHFNIDPDPNPPYYVFTHSRSVFEEGCYDPCEGYYQRQLIDSAHAHGVKVLLCLGGVGGNYPQVWGYLTSDSARLSVALDSMLAYAKRRGYNGVDVDWETPQTHERNQFSLLLRSLRRKLDAWNPPGILAIAAPREYDPAFDTQVINQTVDQFNLMSYDCNGWWSSATGFHAPLYNPTSNWPNYPRESGALNMNDKVPTWINAGLLPEKIGPGLAFYGYKYDGCTQPGQQGSNFWYLRHYQIVNDYLAQGIVRRYDTLAHQPYLSVTNRTPNQFVNYDDEVSLSVKVNWVRSRNLGGVMLFDLNSAYDPTRPRGERHPLMRAVRQSLGPTAPIGTLTADRDTLPPGGGDVTLSWTSANATTASLDQGIGNVPTSGSRSVTVRQTTTFTLTLQNSVGVQRYSVTVYVAGLSAPYGSLAASRDTLPPEGGEVTLSWTSTNATMASIDQGIGTVPPSGSVTVIVRRTTRFMLTLVNQLGAQSYSVTVVVRGDEGGDIPKDFQLDQNFPNPFNPGTTIRVSIPVESRVSVKIFDVLGREVRTLLSGLQPAGVHEVVWDGRNAVGEVMPSGIYFYTMTAGDFFETRKMLLLR